MVLAYDHAMGVPKLGRKSSGVVLLWRYSPGRGEAETSVRVEGGGGDCAKFLSWQGGGSSGRGR